MTLVEVAHGAAFWVLAGEFELVSVVRREWCGLIGM